jgi:hypothetical protein
MRPIGRVRDQTVLHRVEMRVVHVNREIPIVAYCVFPIAPLPNAAFTAARHDRRSWLDLRQGFREGYLDRAPTAGEVGISFRQSSYAMPVIGKNNPGIDSEGRPQMGPADRLTQDLDMPHQ